MPKATYGLALYSALDESIYFSSHRPILSVEKITECYVDPRGSNNDYSASVTEAFRVAVTPLLVWRKSLPEGMGGFLLMDYFIACTSIGGVHTHGIIHSNVTRIPSFHSYGTAHRMNYSVIRTAYYDQFSNLANYT